MADPNFDTQSFTGGYSKMPGEYVPSYASDGATHMDLGGSATKSRVVGEPIRRWQVTLHHRTAAQVAAFRTFYETTVSRSVTPFTWTNPYDGEADIRVKFAPDRLPQIVPYHDVGGYWYITCELVEYLGV